MVGYGKQARAPRRRSLEWERQPGPRLVRAAMVYARRRSWKRCLLEVVAVAVKAYSGTCIGRKRKPHRQGLTLFLPALGTCLGPARPPGQTGSWKKVRGGRPQHRSYSVGKRCSTRGLVLKGDPWRHRALRPVPHTALLPAARGPPGSGDDRGPAPAHRSGPPTSSAAQPNAGAFGGPGIPTKPGEGEPRRRHCGRGASTRLGCFTGRRWEEPGPGRRKHTAPPSGGAGPVPRRSSGWKAGVGRARSPEQTPPAQTHLRPEGRLATASCLPPHPKFHEMTK